MKTFTFLIIIFVFAGAGLFAQQRYMLNHETASPLYYNPGIITQMGQNRIALIHRQQWLGNQGPITQALSVSGRLPNSGLSLGGYLSNDKNGPIRRLSFRAAASYNLVETSRHTLGLGIYLGLLNQAIKAADFNVYDPLIGASEQIPYTGLDAGLGFQYRYSWGENGYVNFGAATMMLPQSFEMGPGPDSSAIFDLPMHLLLNVGASFPINDQVALEPQALIRSTPGP
ncbi:MAG: PorP/SprF family type IX secretion system membrane protein, partial [Bacteroidetes bacterium]|nr:PorP/SprF family type IX secretion system membrane protein [Bacteroidota bacterium]